MKGCEAEALEAVRVCLGWVCLAVEGIAKARKICAASTLVLHQHPGAKVVALSGRLRNLPQQEGCYSELDEFY